MSGLTGHKGRSGAGGTESRVPLTSAVVIVAAVTALVLFTPVVDGARQTARWAAESYPVAGLNVVRQAGSIDCGPAVVATLAGWAGRKTTLERVTELASLGPSGVSLAGFARLSASYGVDGVWYRVPRERVETLATPFVAHLARGGVGHFVAVVAVRDGFALIADPARGAVAGPAGALLSGYSGRAFLLNDPVEPRKAGA